ncbi:MAG: DUF92 domain-containing protein [Bacteroidetes bacterium]|nr:DUF92 domain-containing protein [Bacteroidota bacterium]
MKLFAEPTSFEWFIFFGLLFGILILLLVAEKLRKVYINSPEITRKLVHIGVGLIIFYSPKIFTSGIPPILLCAIFIVINTYALLKGKLKGIHGTQRFTFGTVYYPIAVIILLYSFWDNSPFIISTSILVLAFSDSMAAIVGENIKNPKYYFLSGEKKSYQGSITLFLVTTIIVFISLYSTQLQYSNEEIIMISTISGLIATLLEGVSIKGFDNLTLPLGVAFILHYFLNRVDYSNLYLGIILASVISILSYKLKLLSKNGAVATYLMAFTIFSVGGWKTTTPILIFFILSSILSKIGKNKKGSANSISEKSEIRDLEQVISNGGVATLVIIYIYFTKNIETNYLFYLSTLAAVTADTWGTEIGLFSKKKPRLITNFKTSETGTSGAISTLGIIGGIFGAAIIALTGSYFHIISLNQFYGIILAGIFGSLVDSYFGATIQAEYKCNICEKITERKYHCQNQTKLIRGFAFINNDFINIICAISGLLFSLIYYSL